MVSRVFKLFLSSVLVFSLLLQPVVCSGNFAQSLRAAARSTLKMPSVSPGKFFNKTKEFFKNPWVAPIAQMMIAAAALTAAEMLFAKFKTVIWADMSRSKALQNKAPALCDADQGLIAPETVPPIIDNNIIQLLKDPSYLLKLNVPLDRGLLLTGPNGTGKSQLAYYIARESGCKVIYETAPGLMGQSLGSGTRSVRELIERAKSTSLKERLLERVTNIKNFILRREAAPKKPVIVILDEIDSIALPRFESDASSPEYFQRGVLADRARDAERVRTLEQLLCEVDGADNHQVIPDVFFIYCSNKRACQLSTAFTRVGRTSIVEVPKLTPQARAAIINFHAKRLHNCPLADDLAGNSLHEFTGSKAVGHVSGDVISKAIRNAALKLKGQQAPKIMRKDLALAILEIQEERADKIGLLEQHLQNNDYQWGIGLQDQDERVRTATELDGYTNKAISLAMDQVVQAHPDDKLINKIELLEKLQEAK